MTLLSANDLADMRATQADARPDTCTISRPSRTYTGPGTADPTYSDLATGVAVRISLRREQPVETGIAAAVQGRIWWQASLPYDQAIDRDDRVVISGTTYEVIGILSAGSWMTDKMVALVQVDI